VSAEPLVHRAAMGAGSKPVWRRDINRPLAGIRVLDLTRVLAGPVATRFLAGYGAEVLRLDPPFWDEPALAPEVTLGKRCAPLDLRAASDRGTLERLISETDVLVHGYRPGALDAFGFGAARRRALNPALIDVSLDAYGWTGPWRDRRGFDSLMQMSVGIADAGMRRLGRDRPTPLPVQALDQATGYLMAAAVIRGLTARLDSGAGLEARASLARTASLLVSGDQTSASDLAPETDADWNANLEQTAWGPARRVRAPVAVEGAPMQWDRPAGPLGAAQLNWQQVDP
jgi:crotonobetainyl-CoA:carnitine CoA-transferase CaiB-like acyl-CoA transferase